MRVLLLRRLVPVAVVVAALVAGVPASVAGASPRPAKTVDQQIADIQGLIDETSQAEADALRQYVEVKTRKDAADRRVAAAAGRTAAAAAVAQRAQDEVDATTARIEATEKQIAATEAARQESAKTFLAAAVRRYKMAAGGRTGILRPEDFDDVANFQASQQYLRLVVEREDQEVKRYVALNEQARDEQHALEGQRRELDVARVNADQETARLRAVQGEEEGARAVVAREAAAEKRVVDSISAKRASYEKDLRSLQASSNAVKNQLLSRSGGGIAAPPGSGQLRRPVGGPITSLFGARVHPIFHTVRMHTGVDFGVPVGTSVAAAAAGVCISTSAMSGYGNVVLIDHGNGLATLYAHLSRPACSVGQRVSAGQVIAYSGNTGNSTGPHLHFEVRAQGTPVNPLPYL